MAEDADARDAAPPRYPELYDAFDRSSPIVARDFDAVNDDLLAHCPVAHTARRDEEGYWLVSRFEDVRLLGQSRAFTTAHGLHPGRLERWAPEEVEDPLHTPLRRVIDINLSPRVVQAARPALEVAAHRLIDAFVKDGRVDAVAQYGRRLAGEAFSIVTGMPTEDTPDIVAWFHARFLGATAEERQAGTDRLLDYHRAFLQRRRAEGPRGDLIDAVIAFEHEGFDDEAKAGCITQLSEGGLLTTSNVLGAALLYLAGRPDDRRLMIAEPERLPRALEEWLRTASSVFAVGRCATEAVEVGGVAIAPGDWVYMNFAAANRDPRKFTDPEQIALDRWPNPHVAFGFGRHRCPGSHLARQSLLVGIEAFLARIPDFTTAPGYVPSYEVAGLRTLRSLDLRFDAGGAR